MKQKILTLAVATATVLLSGNALAKDPCKSVLCLSGELIKERQGGVNCDQPVRDYFEIIKFRRGKFSESRTASARRSYLDSCPGADEGIKDEISNRFGGNKYGPS